MYKILKNDTPQKLEIEVLKYLRNGWSVVGGVAISQDSKFYQAIINSAKLSLHTRKRSPGKG
jgi:hypothetical protein